MKRAEKSEYMLIRAYTDSEWDSCDFVILHITDEWKQIMRERLARATAFKDVQGFYYLIYSGSPAGFYKNSEAFDVDDLLSEEEDNCFVNLEETGFSSLPTPDSKLHLYKIAIDSYGLMNYKASGKCTGEEYYTAEFSLPDILKSLK